MSSLHLVLFAALYTNSVYCSYYHGPTAKPVVLHNDYLADTHEVAAKDTHLAALGQQHSYGFEGSYGEEHSGSHGDIRYHGPTAIPHVLHDGHIADTHEVAAAKAEHFAAVAKAKAHGGYGDHYSGSYAAGYGADHGHSHHVASYHGPTAKPVVLHNGYLADTHEVAAKDTHLAALGQQHSYGFEGSYGEEHSGSHGDIRYHGPTAIPHVLHDGHIADTHEVAAAKAEHFAAIAKAKAHGGYGDHYSGSYAAGYGADHGHSHHVASYHGPTAKPVVLHNGYLADTHEVAAAKNTHFAALEQQHSYGFEGSYSEEHSDSHGDIRYHGQTAIPHVLHDGHIADTHEVAAAKAEHFAAVAKAKAHGGYGDHYSGSYASGYGVDHGHTHHVASYHGPLSKPVVLKSGYLADTHEVAATREHHLEALQKQRHHH